MKRRNLVVARENSVLACEASAAPAASFKRATRKLCLTRDLSLSDYTVLTLQLFGQFAVPFLESLDP